VQYTTKTPPGFKGAYEKFTEAQWQGLSFPEEYGGQNLPMSLALIQSEMMAAGEFFVLSFFLHHQTFHFSFHIAVSLNLKQTGHF
jgi:alkylation response protein AidB-like acyl-CoA dehydrogenase